MKKRWLAILCSALVFMLALAVGAVMVSAESSIELDVGYSNLPEYMLTDELGNETVDTSKYLWRIHHTDGTIDYREQFYAFDNIREGDVFEFLPETYALSKLDYASGKTGIAGETGDTVNVYHDFTIDFRGSRLYPKETGDTGRNVFHLAGRAPSTVTVLVEDAELYASPEGRGLFYVNGDLEVIIDGGVRGGSLHAPAAINLEAVYTDPTRASQIINVDIYRISGNMAGCVCARKSSRLIMRDCTVVGTNNSAMVTIRQSGELELYNTEIITTGTGVVVEFSDNSAGGAGLTVGNGSVLYGPFKGYNAENCYFKTDSTSYFSHDITSIAKGGSVSKTNITMTVPYVKSTPTKNNNVYTCTSAAASVNVKLSYVSRAAVSTSATQSTGYPWKLTDKDGKVTYSANLSPLAVPHSYVEARLTESVDIASAETLWITSDITIAADYFITAPEGFFGDLFVIRGTGNTVLGISGATLGTGSLVYYRALGELTVYGSSEIAAARLVRADSAPVRLDGGYWYAGEGAGVWTDGSVTVSNAVINGAGGKDWLIYSPGTVTVTDSDIYASSGLAICAGYETVYDGENVIAGDTSAMVLTVQSTSYSCFTKAPAIDGLSTLVPTAERVTLKLLCVNENGLDYVDVVLFIAYTSERYELLEEKQDDSIYEITLKSGEVRYVSQIYAPFSYIGDYSSVKLISDIELLRSLSISISGDVTLDISGHTVTYGGNDTVFAVEGVGVFKLSCENATVLAENARLFDIDGIKGLEMSLSGASLALREIVSVSGSALTVKGGSFATSGTAITALGSSVSLADTVISGTGLGTLVYSDTDVTLFDGAYLLADTGAVALETAATLYAAGGARMFGTVKIGALSAAEGCRFSYIDQGVQSNIPILKDRVTESITVSVLYDGVLGTQVRRVTYSYVTSPISNGLSVNMRFAEVAELNVYVPASVTELEGFRIRIMHEGVLLDRDSSAGTAVTVGGEKYLYFTYAYVYPTGYLSDVSVTLVAGNFVNVCTASVKELCELSFDAAADNTVKSTVATYAAYASGALCISVPENMKESVHTYSGIYGTDSEISQYFGYVRYDVIGQRLILGAPKRENARISVTYLFGSEELTYTFEPGQSEIAIPIFRLNAASEVRAVFTSSEGVYGCSFNLFDVYAFAKEGTSAKTFLGTLLAYYESAITEQ